MVRITDIEKKVKAIIYDKLGIDEKIITSQSSFINDLHADSIDMIELVVEFEKEFNIRIPEDDSEKFNTVGEVVEYIRKTADKLILIL